MDLIVGRDYNIDLLKVSVSDSLSVQFYNTFNSLSMVPTITRPTRIVRTSCTPVDNFLVRKFINLKTGILSIDITDHLHIFLIYKTHFDNIKLLHNEIEHRDMNELTSENLVNVDKVLGESDVSLGVALLHEKTSYLVQQGLPLKKKVIYIKDQRKPWITPAIKSNTSKVCMNVWFIHRVRA